MGHLRNIDKSRIGLVVAILLTLQCGGAGGELDVRELTYTLGRTTTNTTTNTLNLRVTPQKDFKFQIEGIGFEADVTKGTPLEIQNKIVLSYTEEGTYSLNLKIFYKDGSVFINDTLTWEYNLENPPTPIISFSEDATNDQKITMVAPFTLSKNVKELWVQGDLAEGNAKWHTFTKDRTVPLVTTEADGMKSFRVKYRNIFGSESKYQDLKILKKSIGPADCRIVSNTTVTSSGNVVIFMSATNDGPLYYLISGDASGLSGKWVEFEDEVSTSVAIIDHDAPNNIQVKLRDIASNFCPDASFTITYDEGHEPISIAVENDVMWTDVENITVLPHIDAIPSDTVLMYIHGDIEPQADTFTWIPYQPSIDVELTPVNGNRFVRVQYRVNGEDLAVQSVPIYLKPFIEVSGSSAPYTLSLSEIVGLTKLTVTGCVENYTDISPTTSLSCTPNALTLTVIYDLSDGTSVTRDTPAP